MDEPKNLNNTFHEFDRSFFESTENFSVLGSGSMGGKASGLAFIKDIIKNNIDESEFSSIDISIPRLIVLRTNLFDSFMERNNLYEIAKSSETDEWIAAEFQKASLPTEILGDLRSLIAEVHTPLAIRSSSMLEDAKFEPFAGIYTTKMIANNESSTENRFKKLVEAIKFVYASTFFKAAKDYLKATKFSSEDEKMAVIIQEVIGEKYNERFYPQISGVARSYNYYPINKTKPEDGVVNLALGLGRQIVDGGISWVYSPTRPKVAPPFANDRELIENTQNSFWSVNMGNVQQYDPINEVEYLVNSNIMDAEEDGTLKLIASTFSSESNRVVLGTNAAGPRVLNFGMLLQFNEYNFNGLITKLLNVCAKAYESPVEIEFAITPIDKSKIRFGFLQVRPMVVTSEDVEISSDEFNSASSIVSSDKVLGNGIRDDIYDIVFVKPESFHKAYTKRIALEIEGINNRLLLDSIPYLLVGFGRWGSSDPWLGIPAIWSQISGARVIVESTLPDMNVELSQGSHFFHNLTSFKVSYFSVHHALSNQINWEWMNNQSIVKETNFVKHVRVEKPLLVKVDGKTSRGVILQ